MLITINKLGKELLLTRTSHAVLAVSSLLAGNQQAMHSLGHSDTQHSKIHTQGNDILLETQVLCQRQTSGVYDTPPQSPP